MSAKFVLTHGQNHRNDSFQPEVKYYKCTEKPHSKRLALFHMT